MATHKSAEKRIRQTEKRTAINRSRMSRVRTFVKKVETAIASGDRQEAQSAFQVAQPELHRAITKGVLHKNTVRANSRALPPASTPSEPCRGPHPLAPAVAACARGAKMPPHRLAICLKKSFCVLFSIRLPRFDT